MLWQSRSLRKTMQEIEAARRGRVRCDAQLRQSVTLWEPRFGTRFFPPIATFAYDCSLCLGKNPNNLLPVSVSHSLESCVL